MVPGFFCLVQCEKLTAGRWQPSMRTRAYKRKGAAGPAPGVTERFIGFKAVWLQPPGSPKHRLTVCFRRPVHEGTVLATRVIDNPVPYSGSLAKYRAAF